MDSMALNSRARAKEGEGFGSEGIGEASKDRGANIIVVKGMEVLDEDEGEEGKLGNKGVEEGEGGEGLSLGF